MKVACEVCDTITELEAMRLSNQVWIKLDIDHSLGTTARPAIARTEGYVCGTDCMRAVCDALDGDEMAFQKRREYLRAIGLAEAETVPSVGP